MNSSNTKYWAFRVDRDHLLKLDTELSEGRLRQGWGWDHGQNLNQMTVNEGASRNLPMLRVRKGDRILIPNLPNTGQITIVEAIEDWGTGYRFEIWETGDHCHIFPARRLRTFKRHNPNVPAGIRDTFRNPMRFWTINHCGNDIEKVLQISDAELQSESSVVERWQAHVQQVVETLDLSRRIRDLVGQYTSKAEWEFLLVDALQRLHPGSEVRREGGILEAKHGTDILLKFPNLLGDGFYGVAIQVKDYSGKVGEAAFSQIRHAPEYWKARGVTVIELVVIFVRANREENTDIDETAGKEPPVRVLWAHDVQELVYRSACGYLSESDP